MRQAGLLLKHMWRVYGLDNLRANTHFTRAQTAPGWVYKAALSAAVLVVFVPIVLLVLAALLAGVIVFVILAIVARLILACKRLARRALGGGRPASSPFWVDDGRRNVRVRGSQ